MQNQNTNNNNNKHKHTIIHNFNNDTQLQQQQRHTTTTTHNFNNNTHFQSSIFQNYNFPKLQVLHVFLDTVKWYQFISCLIHCLSEFAQVQYFNGFCFMFQKKEETNHTHVSLQSFNRSQHILFTASINPNKFNMLYLQHCKCSNSNHPNKQKRNHFI